MKTKQKRRAPKRLARKRLAPGVSLALHAVLLVVLLFWYLPRRQPPPSSAGLSASTSASQPAATPSQSQAKSPPPADPGPAGDVPKEQIEASLESQIKQAERLPDEKKLSELEKNLQRLNSIADPESVQQTSATIAESLGLDSDQYAPKPTPAEGEFDVQSAQISDVRRSQSDDGTWQYDSVMVDAEGRTMRVPMTAAEGASLYDTFEMMKHYPMAKGVYQSVVMPMIQKMLGDETQSRQARQNAVIRPQSIEPETPSQGDVP